MSYDDPWERERWIAWQEWLNARYWQERYELALPPDDRLDETGWEIFFYLVQRGMDRDEAARQAMDGVLRQRLRVLKDHEYRFMRQLRMRYDELHPATKGLNIFDSQAPDQLDFWQRHLDETEYVYFIQSGSNGSVKIGLSNDPERRLRQLQTGNLRELRLRHVVPGTRGTENDLHVRFAPARIRGEWFGREYLAIILAFAGGLANEMVAAYDGHGGAPLLVDGATVRTAADLDRIRSDLNRLYLRGHVRIGELSQYTGLDTDEVLLHLDAMGQSGLYDVGRNLWPRHRTGRRQQRPLYRWTNRTPSRPPG